MNDYLKLTNAYSKENFINNQDKEGWYIQDKSGLLLQISFYYYYYYIIIKWEIVKVKNH